MTALVDERFMSRQTAMLDAMASLTGGRDARLRATSMRTLDAVEAYERGIRAYEALEYADALQAFQSASTLDTRHPLPAAWVSRVARLLTQWDMASEAGDRAVALLTADISPDDSLFARAVSAEAHRRNDEAGERYQALTKTFRDEPLWLLELAAFQDRTGKTAESVASYHSLLERDPRMIRPHLELCRLYNSTRMNESGLARQHGTQARDEYAAVGDEIGEALALLCLADILRVGQPQARAEARTMAERAMTMFERQGAQYNLARAFHYMALTRAREDPAGAVVAWEKSLTIAENVKNTVLEATVLVNLGTANRDLGNRSQAVDYYRRSSRANEARGDEQGAAYSLANAGALLIGYGPTRSGNCARQRRSPASVASTTTSPRLRPNWGSWISTSTSTRGQGGRFEKRRKRRLGPIASRHRSRWRAPKSCSGTSHRLRRHFKRSRPPSMLPAIAGSPRCCT
jgi:tetratricopeptide (TPR) repeat protein